MYRFLGQRFGFSPRVVGEMTLYQLDGYLVDSKTRRGFKPVHSYADVEAATRRARGQE